MASENRAVASTDRRENIMVGYENKVGTGVLLSR
jgi:hypothetical protein